MSLVVRKWCIHEFVHDHKCKTGSDCTCAHAEYIGVVVLAGCLCRETVTAECGADTFDLICNHAHTDTGTADENTQILLASGDCLCNSLSIDWVVTGCYAVTAVICHFKSAILQMLDNLQLEFISAVVTSNCDCHILNPPVLNVEIVCIIYHI